MLLLLLLGLAYTAKSVKTSLPEQQILMAERALAVRDTSRTEESRSKRKKDTKEKQDNLSNLSVSSEPSARAKSGCLTADSVQFAKINVVLSAKHFRTTTQ